MHIFHKWEKWEEYRQSFTIHPGLLGKDRSVYTSVEEWQKRTCSVCGYVQREEVKPSF